MELSQGGFLTDWATPSSIIKKAKAISAELLELNLKNKLEETGK